MNDKPFKAIRNIHGQPVPLIGGITSRNLFAEMFGRTRIDRMRRERYTPTVLWMIASVAMIILGVVLL